MTPEERDIVLMRIQDDVDCLVEEIKKTARRGAQSGGSNDRKAYKRAAIVAPLLLPLIVLPLFGVVLAPCVTAELASPADGPGGELRCGPGCGPGDGLRRCGPGGGLGGDQFV